MTRVGLQRHKKQLGQIDNKCNRCTCIISCPVQCDSHWMSCRIRAFLGLELMCSVVIEKFRI
jgi:hypothetical protein